MQLKTFLVDKINSYLKRNFPYIAIGWQAAKAYAEAVGLLNIDHPEATHDIFEQIDIIEQSVEALEKLKTEVSGFMLTAQVCNLICNMEGRIPRSAFLSLLQDKNSRLESKIRKHSQIEKEKYEDWLFASSVRLLCLVKIQMLNLDLEGAHPKQERFLKNAIQKCEDLYLKADSDVKFKILLERTNTRIVLIQAIIQSCFALIHSPGCPTKFEASEKAMSYAQRLSELKLLKRSTLDFVQAKLAEAASFLEHARLTKEGRLAETAILLADEIQEKFPHENSNIFQKAQEIRVRAYLLLKWLRPSDAELQRRSIALTNQFLNHDRAPIRSKLAALKPAVLQAVKSNDMEEVNRHAEHFKKIRSESLKNIALRQEFIRQSKQVNDIADILAFHYAKHENCEQFISILEDCRAMTWKSGAAQTYKQCNWFEIQKPVELNSQVRERVNIIVSISELGLSWCWLKFEDQQTLSMKCHVDDTICADDLYAQIFQSGYFESYFSFVESLGDPNDRTQPIKQSAFNQSLEKMLQWLWYNIASKIDKSIAHLATNGNQHLHLCRSGMLAYVPLHVAGVKNQEGAWECFNDEWIITISDSIMQNLFDPPIQNNDQKQSCKKDEWLGITDPNNDFGIGQNPSFSEEDFLDLTGSQASKAGVFNQIPNAKYISVFSHGEVNFFAPEQSGIALYNNETLSIGDLRKQKWNLTPVFLLGVCESGSQSMAHPFESVGIASGLIWAGAQSVAAAGWSISPDLGALTLQYLSREIRSGVPLELALSKLQRLMRQKKISNIGIERQHLTPFEVEISGESNAFGKLAEPIHWASYATHTR